jgi:hypothetical protein
MREAFLELLGNDLSVAVEHKISQRWGEEKPEASKA